MDKANKDGKDNMTPEQIIQLLDQLGAKLEGPAKYVFELAVRQVVIDGVYSLLVVLTAIAGVVVLVKLFQKIKRATFNNVRTRSDEIDAQMVVFFAGMGTLGASLLALMFAVTHAHNALNYLLNPEYWTLVRLANLVVP